ncbi:type II secretion system F family protein [Rhodovulum sp. YNF3179]|uniref:type II secretion system F family protein n=1 Tax=Rhodovulum sp. YNF3179 TaxID=3425127 RepID=UPI003D328C17
MEQSLILAVIFFAALTLSYGIINGMQSRRDMRRRSDMLDGQSAGGVAIANEDLDRVMGSENEYIRNYIEVLRKERPDSLRSRLIRAGYFSKTALFVFNLIRIFVTMAVFASAYVLVEIIYPETNRTITGLFAGIVAGVAFILVAAVLDRLGNKREIAYRKLFPDFMDLLIVCVDAGLSIEAALDRVAREYLQTQRDFGINLAIITLEVRAGRPMHEAINNFAERVNLEEARSLAILFRQSEELGSSVRQTLRVFSKEMRQLRLTRAEEKANSLAVKMIFPLALFLFPVNLVIVITPVMISILAMFFAMSPGG